MVPKPKVPFFSAFGQKIQEAKNAKSSKLYTKCFALTRIDIHNRFLGQPRVNLRQTYAKRLCKQTPSKDLPALPAHTCSSRLGQCRNFFDALMTCGAHLTIYPEGRRALVVKEVGLVNARKVLLKRSSPDFARVFNLGRG